MRQIIENGELKNINKPARYVGGEVNQIIKNSYKYSVTLCYPNVYEKGMSNYFIRMLYHNINSIEDIYCKRCFAPEQDFEKLLLSKNYELYSLEDCTSIKQSNILLFVIDSEFDYTNFINILKLANIELYKSNRTQKDPKIVLFVPSSLNIKPIEKFVDLLFNEEDSQDNIKKVLSYITEYVASEIVSTNNKNEDINFPISAIIPSIKIENSAIILDVSKINDIDKAINIVKESIEKQGITKISFINQDKISEIKFCEIIYRLKANIENIRISVKNIDFTNFSTDIISGILSCVEKSSITFNVVTCSKRLNEKLNIATDRAKLIENIKCIFKNNWSSIKLVFNIGLPYETYEDIDDIFSVAEEVVNIYSQSRAKDKLSLIVKIKCYIPSLKEKNEYIINSVSKLETKIRYIEEKKYDSAIKVNLDTADTYITKMLLKNGDEEISDVIIEAYDLGARFDGNNMKYNKNAWDKAIYNNSHVVDKYTKFDL